MAKNDTALEVQKSGYLQLADFNMNEAMAEELDGLDGGFELIWVTACNMPSGCMRKRLK